MGTVGKLLTCGGTCAFVFLLGGTAYAQLTKAEQKCIDKYNNFGSLVGQTANTEARACIKNAGKGTEPDPDNCIILNPDGKIAGKEAKVTALYPTTCTGTEPIQRGADTNNVAMHSLAISLAFEIFGYPVSTAMSTDKVEAKCQDAVILRAGQVATEDLKVFRSCKKDGMKLGTIVNSATLQTQCLPTSGIPDPKGVIAKSRQKLGTDASQKCAAISDLPALFPGVCTTAASPADLASCVEGRVDCHICQALNAADGTTTYCDLFDNGVVDGSCSGGQPDGGQLVGGFLWYLGDAGQSCDSTCSSVGKSCDPATITFAGSAGTDQNCGDVLAVLSPGGTYMGSQPGDDGVGCIVVMGFGTRATPPATTCAAFDATPGFMVQRACACQ